MIGGSHGRSKRYCTGNNNTDAVLSIVIDETRQRVPIYAGTGCIGTKDTIVQSQMAKSLGADILSVITPSFALASQHELIEHYTSIAKAVDMPIVLYNIPARTGNSLAPATVAHLSKIENIVGVKDSSGNFDNMLQYIELTKSRKDFAVLSGNDSLIIWNLLAGGAGGITGCANVYPKTMASIYDLFMAGDIEKAKEASDSIRSLRGCFKYGNPNTIVKAAVELLGYPVGKCRAPFTYIPEEGLTALKKVMEENENLGMC
ncbi:MAG: dihydrodipicolinate synthase family protein [Firmicutes bacterium HGW-Firmicutes-5]|nr:MAG: dihydrodipicolinate synthase family protein [Firmicutes bacterium HGW-Firmicutes-5]